MNLIDAIRGRIAEYKTERLLRSTPELAGALEHQRQVQRVARLADDVMRQQSVLASCITLAHRDVTGTFNGPNSDDLADALLLRLQREGWTLTQAASPREHVTPSVVFAECPTCKGKGTVVKNGPSEYEYDSHYPCPTCTTDRTALKGTGRIRQEGTRSDH